MATELLYQICIAKAAIVQVFYSSQNILPIDSSYVPSHI